MSDSLLPNELQHARPPCPSPTPGVYPNPCPWSWWCHPTIILCCSLLLLPSIFPSIRVFSEESALCIRWPKFWSFSFNISPSNEHPGLISFRMDWLDLLAVQGALYKLKLMFLRLYHSWESLNPTNGVIWRYIKQWVKRRTLEEEMATHSSILDWKIPWTEEPGGLQSMELQRVGQKKKKHTTKSWTRLSTHAKKKKKEKSCIWNHCEMNLQFKDCCYPFVCYLTKLLLKYSMHTEKYTNHF